MNASLRWGAVLAAMALALAGCRGCSGGQTTQNPGEVRIVVTQPDGTQTSGANGLYDFGTIPMGTTSARTLVVQNVGLGSLTIVQVSKQSGASVRVGAFVNETDPVFTVELTQETVVGAGQTLEIPMRFAPPRQEGVMEAAYESVLVMTSGDVPQGSENAVLTLRGTGISGECDVPSVLDFGPVAREDEVSLTLALANPQPLDTFGFVGAVQSPQGAGIFSLTEETPKGEVRIASMGSVPVTVKFRPTEARLYSGTLVVRRAQGCPEIPVRLSGLGVDSILSWTPASLEFGYVAPGARRELEVVYSNQSLAPITITSLGALESDQPSSSFIVTDTGSADLRTVTVPPATRTGATLNPGTATVKIAFAPQVLGPKDALLTGSTTLNRQNLVRVPVHGIGGGPEIEAKPSPTLSMGRIAYFSNATPPAFATKKITVRNVGTRPMPADPRGNLKLGKPDGSGGFGPPYFEVVALNGADLSEICVGQFDVLTQTCSGSLPTAGAGSYEPSQGLQAGVAGSIDIPVRVTPRGLGMREFAVKIFSNDPDEPETVITVTANAVSLPPCDIEVTPAALQFGVVAPPSIRDLGFSIRNRKVGAGEVCFLSNLQLLPETGTPAGFPAVFVLPEDFTTATNPLNELDLQPGETKTFVVRAWPQGLLPPVPANVVGKVAFNAADPVAPQRELTLTATIATACLTISPNALDFGTVKKGCNSPARGFDIYNSCNTDVTITSIEIPSAAGEGPGGPNCAGTAACPEFVQVATVPANTVVTSGASTPVNFSVRYSPINLGPDTGAVVLKVTQLGSPLEYVVPLKANADLEGRNTDTFRQDERPKADILLVIDDSGSMGDKQTSLAQNMAAFLTYARDNQVDFHIGVTNTELSGATASTAGLLHSTGTGRKVLDPSTPNLASEFADLVNVGLTGGAESCMAPATKALTAPYVTDPNKNAGFVRADAVLAVVCVTDARDQAPQAPIFYLSQLLNIKGSQRASLFSYNVIGPFLPSPPQGCVYDDANDDRHAQMVSLTNGVKEEICTPDWVNALQRIGKNAFGYRTRFFLTARPDLGASPITVAIDGVPIPQADPNPDIVSPVWTYDTADNSINFRPLYVPEPGKTLTVTYVAACIP